MTIYTKVDTGTVDDDDTGDTLRAAFTKVNNNLALQDVAITLDEVASSAGPGAAKGKLWLRNDTPNVLIFTDDVGGEIVLGAGSGDPDQNLWLNIAADSGGPVAANTITDTLTIAGGSGVSTAIAGDTVTITNDSPNATHTGQVTGATVLALDVTAITAQPASGVVIGTDTMLINDGGVISEVTIDQLDTFLGGGGSGAWTLISTTIPTAVNAIDLTFDETLYSAIKLVADGLTVDTDSIHALIRLGSGNGGTIYSGAADYNYIFTNLLSPTWSNFNAQAQVLITTSSIGNAAGEEFQFTLELNNFLSSNAGGTFETFSMWTATNGATITQKTFGSLEGTEATIDTIQLRLESTAVFGATGTIKMYGLNSV